MQIKIQTIINAIPPIKFIGNHKTIINEIVSIEKVEITNSSLFWCSNKNKQQLLNKTKGSVVIDQETYSFITNKKDKTDLNYLIVTNPRFVFLNILTIFFAEKKEFGNIALSAKIHNSVKLNHKRIIIGEHVVIEKNVTIGTSVEIGHNTVIQSNTIIGNNVKIGANCTIGGVGFGYEMDNNGQYTMIPHIGNVEIHNRVDIGNNVCIDKAVLGSTTLCENVKIDNLVHIAHGVTINKNSLIIANAMIAGSVTIGENTWISPSSSIKQKLSIGSNSLVGMGSVVLNNVEDATTVAGVPSKLIKMKQC